MHAYATLINSSCDIKLRHIWHHIRPRLVIAEGARPIRCIMSGLQYPCDACFWPEIGTHVKSVTKSTMIPSTLIDASSGSIPRFWPSAFCQEAFIPNVVRFPGNLRVLLITDHQVSEAVIAPIFSTLDHTRFLQRGLLAEEDLKTVKRIVEEDWQRIPHK